MDIKKPMPIYRLSVIGINEKTARIAWLTCENKPSCGRWVPHKRRGPGADDGKLGKTLFQKIIYTCQWCGTPRVFGSEAAEAVPSGHKKCPACNKVKKHSEFSRSKRTKDRLAWQCIECRRKKYKAQYYYDHYGD